LIFDAAAALNRQEWCWSVAQYVHMDVGWIKSSQDTFTHLFLCSVVVRSHLVLCFVDLWHHLLVLPGEEDKAVEGTSEDLLAIGRRKPCTSICVLHLNENAESIKQKTMDRMCENGKHRTSW